MRITEEEFAFLKSKAFEVGMTPGAFIREKIRDAQSPKKWWMFWRRS
jgi:hypothetical protein